jgi:hypothetical protein
MTNIMPKTTPMHTMGRTSRITLAYDKLALAEDFSLELCNAPKYINVNPNEEMKLDTSSLSLKNGEARNTTNM